MQRGHGPARQLLEEREMDEVDVEVEDVELVRPPMQLVQHGEMGGEIGLQWVRVEPDGLVADGHQPGLGPGVGAGEQHDVMPELDQGVGKMGHDPLGTAVEAGRHRFVEGRHLCDPHRASLAL